MASSQSLHYRKRAGTGALAGQFYEAKMCSVLFLRGMRHGKFYLASNLDCAGAFDDVGLRLCSHDGSKQLSLIQLKHKMKNEKPISRKQLLSLSPTSKFGLLKYFLSYKKCIRPRFHTGSGDELFGTSLDDLKLVFYTNANIEGERKESNNNNDILSTARCGCIYRFSKEKDQDVWDVWNEWNKTLPDLGDISEFEEFLSKLNMYTNQATESELDELIKMELSEICNITIEIAYPLLLKFFSKIQSWWGSESGEYLTERSRLWDNTIEEILELINDEIKREIIKLDICFSNQVVSALSARFKESRFMLSIVEGNCTILSLSKVIQVMTLENHAYVLGNCKAAVGFWQSRWCSVLVLDGENCNRELLQTILDTLEIHPNKKVIVVAQKNYQQVLSNLKGIPSGYVAWVDKVNLLSLDSVSIQKVLAFNVNFQGHNISLWNLLNDDLGMKENINIQSMIKWLKKLSDTLDQSKIEFKILETFFSDNLIEITNYVVKHREDYWKKKFDIKVFIKLRKYELQLANEMDTLLANIEVLTRFFQNGLLIKMLKILRTKLNEQDDIYGVNNDSSVSQLMDLLNDIPREKGESTINTDTLLWLTGNEFELKSCLKSFMNRNQNLENTVLPIMEQFQKRKMCFETKELKAMCITLLNQLIENSMSEEVLKKYLNSILSLDKLSVELKYDVNCLDTIVSELTTLEAIDSDMLYSMFNGENICIGARLETPVSYYIPRSVMGDVDLLVENALDIPKRVTLIMAEPGMGKTTLLTHVAQQTKSLEPAAWVVTILLNRMTSHLNNIGSTNPTRDHLLYIMRLATEVKHPFEIRLLDHVLAYTGRVIVFLDGFDEICPHYKDTMMAIINELKCTQIQKLWISSRPYLKRDLETITESNIFDLIEFSVEDQKHFLRKIWSERVSNVEETYLSSFIDEVVGYMSQSLSDTERSFMGLPLQTVLVAEAFERDLMEGRSTDKLGQKLFNITDLYERFFLKKCNIYFQKEGIDTSKTGFRTEYDNKIKDIERHHEYIALLAYVSHKGLISITNVNLKALSDKFIEEYEDRWASIGIVTLLEGIPLFTHRTVIEYFVASYLSKHFETCQEIILTKLFTIEYSMVKVFFDQMLSKGSDIHLQVLNGNVDMLQTSVIVSEMNVRDRGGRTPLHLAVSCENTETLKKVIQILLDSGADLNAIDNVLKCTPLEYAVHTHNFEAINMILGKRTTTSKVKILQKNAIHSILEACRMGYVDILRYFVKQGYDMNKFINSDKSTIACTHGQLQVVKYLLGESTKRKLKINAEDSFKRTALHTASEKGHHDIVKLLVDRGCNLDVFDSLKQSPLHLAIENGHVYIARILIQAGCNLNACTKDKLTPLQLAVQNGHTEVVRHLLRKGCNVNTLDMDNRTVLHVAVRNGYVDIVRLLIKSDCDINKCDGFNQTPLHTAAHKGIVDVGGLLIDAGCHVDALCTYKRTPLHIAARKGHVDFGKLLFVAECKVDECDQYLRTPLHHAVEGGHADFTQLLVDMDCNVNAYNRDRDTPLHIAARRGHVECGKVLIAAGCNVDAWSQNETSLHIAARYGYVDYGRVLIEAGCSISACEQILGTPLHIVAKYGHVEFGSMLIDAGCDVDAFARNLERPLHIAAQNGHADIGRVLIRAGCNINACTHNLETPLHMVAYHHHVDIGRVLIEAGCDVDARNQNSETPLHIAVRNNNVDIGIALIDARCDVNARSKNSETPLHIAARYGYVEFGRILIENGCDIHGSAQNSETALHIATRNENVDIGRLLIEAGCDVDARDRLSQTPLHMAARKGNVSMGKILIEAGCNKYSRTRNLETPLDLTEYNGRAKFRSLLLN